MSYLSFENLDFSFLIEPENKTAYLQEWEEGAWGEAQRYTVPVALDELPKHSKLARAIKSFRRDPQMAGLRSALEAGLVREPVSERARWSGLAARILELIYA